MPHSQKSRSKAPTSAKSVRGLILKPTSPAYTFALPRTEVKKLGVEMPPGVTMTFVATSRAAVKKLKTWTIVQTGKGSPDSASEVINRVKVQVKIASPAYEPSARARALLQGKKIVEADLKEAGGTFKLEDVQKLLNGVSRQALEKRVKEGSLLAIPGPSNRRRYPTIQFTDDGVVPGLKKVQEALPTRNPWAVLNFLVHPDDRLRGRKPIDVLRNGDVELVVSAARSVGVQGG